MDDLMEILGMLPEEEQAPLRPLAQAYQDAVTRELGQIDFMTFVKSMWPNFISGAHHALMATKFEEIASGKTKRLIINMPPRHTKSEFASYLLPAWYLGKFPNKKIIQCSNTADLAVGFGRKVRNLVDGDVYPKIFPNVALRSDSKAAGRWSTNANGEYFAIGVGGTVTGKGADLLIIDDPHSEQEAALAMGDPSVFDKVYEWYTSGPRQRLQPGGSIVVVMCMTGNTNVLLADGGSTHLKDIRPGDMVATFDNGRLGASKVNNWRSSGVDSIYTVQTQSGIILRANERHPFLAMNEGVLEWTRLSQLRVGDELVSLKGATDPLEQKQNPGYAPLACPESATTEKTQTRPIDQLDTTESGKKNNAGAENQLKLKGCAVHATQSNSPQQNLPRSKAGLGVSNTGMGLLPKTLYGWLMNAAIGAMSVGNNLLRKTQGRIGAENYVSTTTITPEQFAGYSATTATSQLDMARRQMFSNELWRISDFTTDPIISITPSGVEEVFDVEIDRTENFIANGVVSHNTRWSKRDLTGKICQAMVDRDGDEWEIISLPAIKRNEKPLWPEFWSYEELDKLRIELPLSKWQAQYQQDPTSEEGALVKREWWKAWEQERPPPCHYVIQSWDTAFTKSERADYSACTTWGVFYLNENEEDPNIILLDAFKERMEFPTLKERAYDMYKDWEPDSFIVEAKASGAPLIFELRRMGIPVQEFTPTRGNDKISRVNSVSDLFASGKVWAPRKRWAEEVIEELAAFPNSDHDDLVDSTTQALLRFRRGGFLVLPSDEPDEPREFKRKKGYY